MGMYFPSVLDFRILRVEEEESPAPLDSDHSFFLDATSAPMDSLAATLTQILVPSTSTMPHNFLRSAFASDAAARMP